MSKKIPLSIPFLIGNEWKYIKECLDTGWVSSAGKFVDHFEEKIRKITKSKHAIAISSGTAALHIALEIVGVRENDEVIVPTVTFIAPVNAIRYLGAVPIFMDCDDYYNMDVEKTTEFILNETEYKDGYTVNKKTKRIIKAIVPVHVFGNAAKLFDLVDLCDQRNIKIVEDATESLGTFYTEGKFSERHTATIGDVGCFSFNGNKIITTGGGGMIVTNNTEYANRSRYLISQAKDDDIYYVHNEIGYNYRLNNIQAALGAQLENLRKIIDIKQKNYNFYVEAIKDIEGLRLAGVPSYSQNNYWMYALQIDTKIYGQTRDEMIKHFYERDVEVRVLWHLNHLQKPNQTNQTFKIEKALKMLEVTLNIPCGAGLTDEDLNSIVGCLNETRSRLTINQ